MLPACALLLAAPPAAAQMPRPDSSGSDSAYVIYRDSPMDFPIFLGFRLPSYDRINGLTIPWGPRLTLGEDVLEMNVTVSYRSNLGKFDPGGSVRLAPGHDSWVLAEAGRGTFSNDSWIRGDVLNSAASIGAGSDSRNYYRADLVRVSLGRNVDIGGGTLEPSAGIQRETAWSTGSSSPPLKSPWSVFGRNDPEKMKRPNPAVSRGSVSSAYVASTLEWEKDRVEITGAGKLESVFDAPQLNSDFHQVTLDLRSKFPALLNHLFELRLHVVETLGGLAPPQRFSYIGGAGTIATMKLLEQGGDRLFYVSGLYIIPVKAILLPVAGNPYVALRYSAGAAGVGKLPPLIQNITPVVGVRFIRAEYSYDPASKKSAFSLGLSLSP